jgi:hypothetical protein
MPPSSVFVKRLPEGKIFSLARSGHPCRPPSVIHWRSARLAGKATQPGLSLLKPGSTKVAFCPGTALTRWWSNRGGMSCGLPNTYCRSFLLRYGFGGQEQDRFRSSGLHPSGSGSRRICLAALGWNWSSHSRGRALRLHGFVHIVGAELAR